jgi:hypothetical protein
MTIVERRYWFSAISWLENYECVQSKCIYIVIDMFDSILFRNSFKDVTSIESLLKDVHVYVQSNISIIYNE